MPKLDNSFNITVMDYLTLLFGDNPQTEAERLEGLARMRAIEDARLAQLQAAKIRPHCGKCGGSGRIPAFRHIANGICFACN